MNINKKFNFKKAAFIEFKKGGSGRYRVAVEICRYQDLETHGRAYIYCGLF